MTAWLTRERLLILVLLAASAFTAYLCFLLVEPFVPALAWALAVAIVARPMHDAIARKVRNANVAAALAVFVVAVVLIVPALVVLRCLVQEATAGAERLQAEAANGGILHSIEATPWLGDGYQWLHENVDFQGALRQASAFLARSLPGALVGSAWAVIQLLIVLFILFFFFRDRALVLRSIRSLLPLSTVETDEVLKRTTDTIQATIHGSLVVGLIQGTMGGLMFWWLGLPSPVLWGAIMAVLAVVPNLGTFIVWAPAALFLALNGETGRALILASWGAIAIGLIDNVLYPLLVGRRMRLHTLAAFIAIVGGLYLLGPSGVVLGPVILAVAIALIDVWRRRTADGKAAEVGVAPSLQAVSGPHEHVIPNESVTGWRKQPSRS